MLASVRTRVAIAIILGGVFAALSASAQDRGTGEVSKAVSIYGRQITLIAPAGHCFFDEKIDAGYIEFRKRLLPSGYIFLGEFFPCDFIAKVRSGESDTLNAHGGVYSTLDRKSAEFATPRAQFIDRLSARATQMDPAKLESYVSSLINQQGTKKALNDVGLQDGGFVTLGLVGKDLRAMYMGGLRSLAIDGTPLISAVVSATTVTRGLMVACGLEDQYENRGTVTKLQKRLASLMEVFVAANGP